MGAADGSADGGQGNPDHDVGHRAERNRCDAEQYSLHIRISPFIGAVQAAAPPVIVTAGMVKK